MNGSQTLLPNDYQRNIDYIQWKEDFVWGRKKIVLAKYFLKQNIITPQKKRTLKG